MFSFFLEGSITFLADLNFPTDEKIELFLIVVFLRPSKATFAGFCGELLGGLLLP